MLVNFKTRFLTWSFSEGRFVFFFVARASPIGTPLATDFITSAFRLIVQFAEFSGLVLVFQDDLFANKC